MEDAATPRITAGFSSLQSNLQALQTVLSQLMHVNVRPGFLAFLLQSMPKLAEIPEWLQAAPRLACTYPKLFVALTSKY